MPTSSTQLPPPRRHTGDEHNHGGQCSANHNVQGLSHKQAKCSDGHAQGNEGVQEPERGGREQRGQQLGLA